MLKCTLINTSRPLSKTDIKKVGIDIGCRFPQSLSDFYLRFNGGEAEGKRRIFESNTGIQLEVATFLPILHKRFKGDSLLEDSYWSLVREQNLIPQGYIPFAMDPDGFRYWMDCKTGEVFYSNFVRRGKTGSPMQQIASTLVEFVNGLVAKNDTPTPEMHEACVG